jgi:hypothetical protein
MSPAQPYGLAGLRAMGSRDFAFTVPLGLIEKYLFKRKIKKLCELEC